MRVICPRCGAQYEIDRAAIPPAGREVECSACGHLWRQPGAPFDPAERPVLSRPLGDSILSVLREEAARELAARARDAGNEPPGLGGAETRANATNMPGQDDDQPLADPRMAHLPPAPPGAGLLAAHLETGILAGRNATAADAPAASRHVLHRADPARSAADETETLRGDVAPGLPADAPVHGAQDDLSAAPGLPPDHIPALATAPVPAAPSPVGPASPSRSGGAGYRAGFAAAVMVAALAVAGYALAPRLAGTGQLGAWTGAWHAQVDYWRGQMHDQIDDWRGTAR